jgi:co-chaperonin GroES (HSP10)
MIRPIQSRLLIELKGGARHINTTEEQFGSYTRGVVRAIAEDILKDCVDCAVGVGDTVYFGKYEDTAPYDIDGKKHILIKLEEITGVEDAAE